MKTPKPKQWDEQEVRRLVRLARARAGVSKIAAELGRHAGSVRRMARTRDTVEEVAVRERYLALLLPFNRKA